jgi:hypothetical protein
MTQSAKRRAKNCQCQNLLYLYAMRHALCSMRSDRALRTRYAILNKLPAKKRLEFSNIQYYWFFGHREGWRPIFSGKSEEKGGWFSGESEIFGCFPGRQSSRTVCEGEWHNVGLWPVKQLGFLLGPLHFRLVLESDHAPFC